MTRVSLKVKNTGKPLLHLAWQNGEVELIECLSSLRLEVVDWMVHGLDEVIESTTDVNASRHTAVEDPLFLPRLAEYMWSQLGFEVYLESVIEEDGPPLMEATAGWVDKIGCSMCGETLTKPHSWKACAQNLREARNAFMEMAINPDYKGPVA